MKAILSRECAYYEMQNTSPLGGLWAWPCPAFLYTNVPILTEN